MSSSFAKYTAKNNFESIRETGKLATRGCNVITFYNQGDVTFFINRVFRFQPGESFTLSQVELEIEDETEYEVRFDIAHPASTGTNAECMIITTFLKEKQTGGICAITSK